MFSFVKILRFCKFAVGCVSDDISSLKMSSCHLNWECFCRYLYKFSRCNFRKHVNFCCIFWINVSFFLKGTKNKTRGRKTCQRWQLVLSVYKTVESKRWPNSYWRLRQFDDNTSHYRGKVTSFVHCLVQTWFFHNSGGTFFVSNNNASYY